MIGLASGKIKQLLYGSKTLTNWTGVILEMDGLRLEMDDLLSPCVADFSWILFLALSNLFENKDSEEEKVRKE